MVKVLIKQINSRKEIISIVSIAILTIGGIWESLMGPSYVGWACIIIGICGLFFVEKRFIWKSPFLIPILVLGIISIISYFITTSAVETVAQLSRLWAGVIVCVIYVNWAKETYRQILITLGLIAIGAGLAFMSPLIVQWAVTKGGILPSFLYNGLPNPIVEDTVHPNTIASIMILLLPIPFAYAIIILRQLSRQTMGLFILSLGITGILSIPLLLSKSRAGLLAGGLSMIFLLWFCHYRKIAGILTLILSGVVIFPIYSSTQNMGQLSNDVLNSGSFMFRIKVWEISVMMLQDFPFTGIGIGTFNDTAARLYPAFWGMFDNPGAHNIFFQIGVDLGLIGLTAMMAIYILVLYMGRESVRIFAQQQDQISWAMSAGLTTGLIAILLHGITDINVWGTRGTFAPWLVMGLIGAIYASTRLAKE